MVEEIVQNEKYDNHERLWIKLSNKINQNEVFLGLIYGPQENDKESDKFYKEIENNLCSFEKKGDIIILGDFNAKIQNIDSPKFSQKISNNGITLIDSYLFEYQSPM